MITKKFFLNLNKDLPTYTYGKDNEMIRSVHDHLTGQLDEILTFLKENEIEAVNIMRDAQSPIQIEQAEEKIKIQKKRLKKLSKLLKDFAEALKYFKRTGIGSVEITTNMRNYLRKYYEDLLVVYNWYSELFQKEANK